jgi:nickel-dependent lactate racemase
MKTINVDVPEDIARRYLNMSPSEQLSVSKELVRILEKRKGLREIMDDMSEQAKKNGLTPELLEELLKD